MIGAEVGGWLLEGELGRGGAGVVRAARHRETGARAAIKLPHPELGEPGRARIAREGRVLARVRHAGVVRLEDQGEAPGGAPWLALERLHGADLRALVRRGPVAPERAAAIARALLSALEAVHELGVVHRDVKPANVFACDDGTVRLLDFGVAHAPFAPPLGEGCVGSPRFMAPEQIVGGRLDARADVYAVGLLLFELVTGGGPFDGFRGSFEAMGHAHLSVEPERASRRAPVSRALDGAIARALRKHPDDRFPSARAMRLALEAAAAERGRAVDAGSVCG